MTYYLGSYHHVFAFYSHEPPFRVIFYIFYFLHFKTISIIVGAGSFCYYSTIPRLLFAFYFSYVIALNEKEEKKGINLFHENDR